MNYRLDKYGNKLSILGFGCMRFQRKAGGIDQSFHDLIIFCDTDVKEDIV